jgi:prepilin-type N-terminal cleavage/methylation domain-containing protein
MQRIQNAECRMQNDAWAHRPRFASSFILHPSSLRRGFTLTEMLIVIGILVIVMLLAVPAFRAMTGSRSSEAAQNQISAVLSRVRTEAVGVQEPRGMLFYRDLETQRIGMAAVRAVNSTPPYELDLIPDRDFVLLPEGVGIQFIDDDVSTVTGDEDRYIGFNTRVVAANATNETRVAYGGVVLFDGQGQLATDAYAFRVRYPAGPSQLGRFLYDDPSGTVPTGPVVVPNPAPAAKLGFVLYDGESFASQFREGRPAGVTEDQDTQVDTRVTYGTVAAPPSEAAEEDWLNKNSTPVLVNRYNGTLIRAE